ncbi:MAG: HAD family hydrolase [Clostridia bacterium]|nr:HAD family hydrolase [Clostridia bacterium]
MKQISFTALGRNCLKDMSGLAVTKFALLGDCATQHIARAIRGYAYEMGQNFEVFDADYDQIDAQIMDEGSEMYRFKPDTVLIYRCTQRLYERFTSVEPAARGAFAENEAEKLAAQWERVASRAKADILSFLYLPMDDGVFGSYALREETSFPFQLMKLNFLLAEKARALGSVRLIDLSPVQAMLGEEAFCDAKMYMIAKMPMSTAALPLVASRVVDAVLARKGRIHKCAVVDLDNTLWGGVIGDDGINGIEIGELGQGHAFSEFQTWLKELKNRGVMLAVCSKNDEANAREPFEKHPDMVLRLNDFSAFVANWENKADNIRLIQKQLNIGFDSMVFFDDNPFERQLVRTMLPEVEVPELPEDPAEYVRFVRAQNLFDTATFSDEDRVRTERYLAEQSRTLLSASLDSYDDYLKALEMKAVAAPFDAFHIPRIAQLTQRSNQFNLRTVRYSEEEVAAIAADERFITRYYTLSDRFGEHGLIAVVILEKREDCLFVNEWLMSCRVLKRGMEQFIADSIISAARQAGFDRVRGEYIPTAKNAMVKDLYQSMGFTPLGGGLYEVDTRSYKNHEIYITEE